MCIHIINLFSHAQLCANDCFAATFFPRIFGQVGLVSCFLVSLATTTDEIENPWCPILMVSSMELRTLIFRYRHLCGALQRVNIVVRLAHN